MTASAPLPENDPGERAGIMVFDDRGTLIVEHLWPPPGIRYVGNGQPRGPKPKELPPMS